MASASVRPVARLWDCVRRSLSRRVLLAAASAAAMAVCVAAPARDAGPPAFDLIIEHGHVIDGTGAPWYAADVGIRAGRIAAIGRLDRASAKQRIDAAGRVVAPGFIDMLGQS